MCLNFLHATIIVTVWHDKKIEQNGTPINLLFRMKHSGLFSAQETGERSRTCLLVAAFGSYCYSMENTKATLAE